MREEKKRYNQNKYSGFDWDAGVKDKEAEEKESNVN